VAGLLRDLPSFPLVTRHKPLVTAPRGRLAPTATTNHSPLPQKRDAPLQAAHGSSVTAKRVSRAPAWFPLAPRDHRADNAPAMCTARRPRSLRSCSRNLKPPGPKIGRMSS